MGLSALAGNLRLVSLGLSRNWQCLRFLAEPALWVSKFWRVSKDSRAFQPDVVLLRSAMPCVSSTFLFFDSYVQWPMRYFYFMYISAFFHVFAGLHRHQELNRSRQLSPCLLFCGDLLKILESPREYTQKQQFISFL